jgi:hypothetical protein
VLTILVLVIGAVLAFNLGVLHGFLETQARKAVGGPVKLGSTTLTLPLRLVIGASSFEMPLGVLSWERLELKLHSLAPPYDVEVTVFQPKWQQNLNAPSAPAQPSAAASTASPSRPPPLRLRLRVRDGYFALSGLTLSAVDLSLEQKLLLVAPASLHLTTQAWVNQLGLPLNLAIDSESLTLSREAIKAGELKASVDGLQADVRGTSLLSEDRHRWRFEISVADLARLPVPPAGLPAQNWKGAVHISGEARKDRSSAGWQGEGQVDLKGVSAYVKWSSTEASALGPLALDLSTQLAWSDQKLRVPALRAKVDLTAMALRWRNVLEKGAAIPLLISAEGSSDGQVVQVKTLDLKLAQVNAHAEGAVALPAGMVSDVKLSVPSAHLAGLDQIFLPLKKSPVQGELAVEAHLKGPWREPLKGEGEISRLSVQGLAAQVDYAGAVQVHGRVTGALSGQGQWSQGAFKGFSARGGVDLRAVALVAGPLSKAENQDLAAEFALNSAGGALNVEKLDVHSFLGRVRLKGQVTELAAKPKLNLTLSCEPLKLDQVRLAAPSLHDLLPQGEVRAQVNLVGAPEPTQPWYTWPLQVRGDVTAILPEYRLVSAPLPPAPSKGAPPSPPPAPQPFLPNGALTANAQLRLALELAHLHKDEVEISGVSVHGQYAGGHFRGETSVQQIFSGHVSVKDLDVPMLEPRPTIQGTAQWIGLQIESALMLAPPAMRTLAEGKTAGQMEFATLMTADEDFMKKLRLRGQITANPVTLNAVKPGAVINDMIKKVPLIPPVKVEPMHGDAHVDLDLQAQTVQVNQLVARDVGGSEIQLKGKVLLPALKGDLMRK